VWWAVGRGIRSANDEMKPSIVFVALTALLLVAYAWQPDRLMIPALPVLAWLAYRGTPTPLRPWLAMVAAVPILTAYGSMAKTEAYGFPVLSDPPWVKAARYPPPPEWSKVKLLYAWVATNAPDDAVILANYDASVYLYTGRRALRPFTVENMGLFYGSRRPLDEKLAELQSVIRRYRPAYLLESGHDNVEEPDFTALLQQLRTSSRIREVFRSGDNYAVYEIED